MGVMGFSFEGGGYLFPRSAGHKNGRFNPPVSMYLMSRWLTKTYRNLYLSSYVTVRLSTYFSDSAIHLAYCALRRYLKAGPSRSLSYEAVYDSYLVALSHHVTLHCVTRRLSHVLLLYASCNIHVVVVVSLNINAEYHTGFFVVMHIIVIHEYVVLCNVETYSMRKESSKKCRNRVVLRVCIASVPSKYMFTHAHISNVFIFRV